MKRMLPFLLAVAAMLQLGARVEAARPALVVFIVIDQLRGDYLDAFGDHFTDGGFKRMMRDGAWFDHAYYTYGSLATGPGHASLATGSTPSTHGIVGNDWYALDEGEAGRYCCTDDSVRNIGYPEGKTDDGRSPRQLVVETFGDQIKAAVGGEVWGVALKDRAAILTAGKRASGAFWWDSGSGNFITSTYYAPRPPDMLTAFNDSGFANRYFGKPWELLLPAGLYDRRLLDGAGADIDREYHAGEFPKILGRGEEKPNKAYYNAIYASPFGNDLVFELVRRVIETRNLGSDDATDVITVCLSSNDVIGHLFGPDSPEVMDCTLRTDRQLAEFFNWLDERVGLSKCLVTLSSDHGVGPITEYAKAAGVGGGRIQGRDLVIQANECLKRRLTLAEGDTSFGKDVVFPWLYLDEKAIRDAGGDVDEAARVVADALRGYEGVEDAFATPDIRKPEFAGSSDLKQFVRNSYFPGRSGHVYVHWKRYWYQGKKLAGHGAAYDYDQHVPVLLMGSGVKPGRYARKVCPTGLAVTICKLLDIDPPATSTGEVYNEAMLPQPKTAGAK